MIDSCPICHRPESKTTCTVSYGKEDYLIVQCGNCSHYYSKFDITQINSASLYNDEVYQVIDNRDSVYSKIMDYEYGQVLKTVRKWYPQRSRILDFGSGKGNFLFLAKKFGFDVFGVETARERAEFARQKFNLDISQEMYTAGKIKESSFDVITLFHVLEHLPDPKEILSNLIKDNLNDNGLLILEVPNFSSLQSSIAKNRWMHLDIPRHLSHFTDIRLVEFAKELNFKVVKKEYFSLHLGVMGMCHSILSLFGYRGKIIKDLKHYNPKLVFGLLLILPFAFVLEFFSSGFNKGGVIRLYCRKDV